MSKFSIPIYDKNELGEYESIDFQYFTVVADMLSNLSDSKDFLSIYDNRIPEYIDASIILKTSSIDRNLVATRINKILLTYPVIARYYEHVVKGTLKYLGDYATRAELLSAIDSLNRLLDEFR